MEDLSDRIKKMSLSQTVMMNQKSQDLKAKGIDVINLSVGEPDFNTPGHIKNAAKKAIDDNYTFYSPVPGYYDLREAISKKLKDENGLDYKPSQVVVSNGAKHALSNVILSLIDVGDEVIIPAPYWVSYYEQVKIAGGIPVVINTTIEQGFKASAEQINRAITKKTKALLICSPNNPAGSLYDANELEAIAKVIEKQNIYVIADEIYEYINFVGKHESIAQIDTMKDRAVIINGVSKGFAMTGWRIGYMAGPEWLARACIKLQGQLTTGPCSVSQRAALAALTGDKKTSVEMVKHYLRRRDMVLEFLDNMEGVRYAVPDGAFYVFPDISYYFNKSWGDKILKTSTDISMYLLEQGHVGTVPGEAFGIPECLRISFATSDEALKEGLSRITNALEHLYP